MHRSCGAVQRTEIRITAPAHDDTRTVAATALEQVSVQERVQTQVQLPVSGPVSMSVSVPIKRQAMGWVMGRA
jgi:hypothetical protein